MRATIFAAAAAALAIAGCATPYRPTAQDAAYSGHASAVNRPLIPPTRSFSSYSASLSCMDRLLRDMRLPTTLITSKNIPDASGKVSVASKEMVITALSQMSRTSSAFRFVDYEVDLVKQDTVQNLTTLLLGTNQMQIQRPALYVSGAVTFVDQSIINNQFDIGTSAARLETGYSQNRSANLVGLELHLGEFRTRTLIPGVDSSNEIVISNGGKALDVAGRIGAYGVQFNVGRDFSQGTGAAIRTLIELGIIEIIGKWARVPYWQCLSLEQTHPDFQRSLLDWYTSDSQEQRRSNMVSALSARGYFTAGPDVGEPELKKALVRFQTDEDLVTHGLLTFEVYERALRDYVRVTPQGVFSRVGWDKSQVISIKTDDLFNAKTLADTSDTAPAITSTAAVSSTALNSATVSSPTSTSTTSTSAIAAASGNRIDLKIENVPTPANRNATSFAIGEKIFMSAVLQQTSHIWCYFQDATGTAMRIYPNATHRYSLTQANRSIRLPDWMNPNPGFFIETSDPGQENVACFAHEKDLLTTFPNVILTTPAFEPMKGETLASIEKLLTESAGDQSVMLYKASLGWVVRNKLEPAAKSVAVAPPSTPSPPAPSSTPNPSPNSSPKAP